jgi:hypothetical protein
MSLTNHVASGCKTNSHRDQAITAPHISPPQGLAKSNMKLLPATLDNCVFFHIFLFILVLNVAVTLWRTASRMFNVDERTVS